MTSRPYVLAETTYGAVRETRYDVAVLPWGATEAHNLHLPYATDTTQAERGAIEAARLAWERGAKVVVLPAVPFGGKFRIIDFPLSNCMNSGIRRVGILTQYKAHSLIKHIQRGWGFLRGELGEFVELLPAQQRIETSWYTGTADAVYQNLDIIRNHDPSYVLVLAGEHV